jgi:glycosyltransferase involved in cell wall biosynthesis
VRFLLVNYEYPPLGGGAANATRSIGRSLAGQGHDVTVLTAAFGPLRGSREEEGMTVYRIPALRSRADRSNTTEMLSYLISAGLSLRRVLRERPADGTIVFFSLPCGPLGMLAERLRGGPYVISLRGGDVPGLDASVSKLHRMLGSVRRRILRSARAVVANSRGLARASMAVDPIATQVIPNGVDAGFFSPPVSQPEVVDGPFRFLFVGRFHAQKNLPFMLEQIAILRSESGAELWLDMVGDGPQRTELEALAQRAGLAERVVWHGWCDRERLREQYQAADCMLNLSVYEGMPNTVLEAMACGLPVVATDILGNNEVVADAETGFLVPPNDGEATRRRLRQLLEDRPLARTLGARGRSRALREFDWDEVARRYAALFTRG